jgi:hypothetical protein
VNTSPKKTRKTAFLIFVVVGLLVLLCVVLMRNRPSSGISKSSDTRGSFRTRTSSDSVSAPATPSRKANHPSALSSAATNNSGASGDELSGGSDRYGASLRSPAIDSFVATGLPSTAFGVVDLERLIAAHSSGVDSQDTRAALITDIRRIVGLRAKAYGFAFVFDISARSPGGTPFVLATNGVPDITDEVLLELSE